MWKKFVAHHLLESSKIYAAADKEFDHIWFYGLGIFRVRKQQIIYAKEYIYPEYTRSSKTRLQFQYIDGIKEEEPFWIYELLPIDSDLFCSENAQFLILEQAQKMKVIRERAAIFNPKENEIY